MERRSNSVPPAPELCYCVSLEPERKPVILPLGAVSSGQCRLTIQWQEERQARSSFTKSHSPVPVWSWSCNQGEPGNRLHTGVPGTTSHPREKKFQIPTWSVHHSSLLGPGWRGGRCSHDSSIFMLV